MSDEQAISEEIRASWRRIEADGLGEEFLEIRARKAAWVPVEVDGAPPMVKGNIVRQ